MALNCKPGQLAWIDVPRQPDLLAIGMTQLHGHVVRAEQLLPAVPGIAEQWQVSPPQSFRMPNAMTTPVGTIPAGALVHVGGIPDSWLRPFGELSQDELEKLVKELSCA